MSAIADSGLDSSRHVKQHSCNGAVVDGCLANCVALRERPKDAGELLQHFGKTTPKFSARTSMPRRTIFRSGEPIDGIPIICSGWAAAIASLGGARRQIISFLLPGDLVSGALVFEDRLNVTIEAVGTVTYHKYDRAEFRAALAMSPSLLKAILKSWIDENRQIAQLVANMGQCSAQERIAQLILKLSERLAKRHMVKNGSFQFPLRQRHIAEHTALTPAHVSSVIRQFRRAGLIRLNHRLLTVSNPAALKQLSPFYELLRRPHK